MKNILIITIIVLSPLLVLAWANLIYLIVHKNKEEPKELSVLAITSLYIFSLVPIGLFIGYYLANKRIEINGLKINKYSKNIQSNGNLILIISIASTIFSLMNLK